MEQLFFAVEGIDRRDKSPRLVAFEKSKAKWERFMEYHFALRPTDDSYRQLFPYLKNLDSDTLAPDKLEYFADFFAEARDELDMKIRMTRNWNHLGKDDQFYALLHWVEWGNIFPDVDIPDGIPQEGAAFR